MILWYPLLAEKNHGFHRVEFKGFDINDPPESVRHTTRYISKWLAPVPRLLEVATILISNAEANIESCATYVSTIVQLVKGFRDARMSPTDE